MKKILRFYLSNTDTLRHASLYEEIARAAQRDVKYPIVVEIIDDEEKLRNFLDKILPTIKSQPKGILVTLQDVDVVLCK